MDVQAFVRENFVRVLAIICLFVGLGDASRLLGVSSGTANPLNLLGITGFVLLSVFTLARLFAAVGLWINASWGGVLLIGATLFELALVLTGSPDIYISPIGMIVRLALFLGIAGFLGLRYWNSREHVHD